MKIKQFIYLGWWFFGARVLGRKRPLQTVLFISDRCNLECKHCSVYNKTNPHQFTYEQVREQLQYAYNQGSRFVDLEGGEVMIWRDGDYRINDLIDLAKEIGFFSATITTNAQLPLQAAMRIVFGLVSMVMAIFTKKFVEKERLNASKPILPHPNIHI